ncbi:DMT family transporter [Pseudoruegeria sp. HB172150]|uniref:DMT family transporter n=1 Tax=Pseudoruegeria sp. HB172150 TaxID=2721164 RepID=UPI001555324B|nr:DMT family transporter [Pseudoruegeria sp. HB172150]
MHLFLLTALVMIAFAANSVLNRLALAGGEIGATEFAVWRVASGAVALAILVLARGGRLRLGGPYRLVGVVSLTVYMLAFSLAYLSLDTGVGALILFGGVQITMFVGAVIGGERVPPMRWAGACVALAGLAWLFWPGSGAAISWRHGALMAAAAVGWGLYSLIGRVSGEPLKATAANFALAVPVCVTAALVLPASTVEMSNVGLALALTSGIVTSAMGYALWYSVLPRLPASQAAVAQLTVPVIAILGGVVFLGEVLKWEVIGASTLVLGGVALSVRARR